MEFCQSRNVGTLYLTYASVQFYPPLKQQEENDN